MISRKERNSARGNRFAFVQVSDTTGIYEVMVFSEVLAHSRELLESGQPLLVTVDVRAEEDTLRLTAQRFEPLDRIVAQAEVGLRVILGAPDALTRLKELIGREGGGKGRVSVVVPVSPEREVEIALPGGFKVTPSIRQAVGAVAGVLDVVEV